MKTLWWQTVGTGNCHLVLLHGWGLNAEVWRCISEELASQFTVHLVDLPGYGRSHGYGAMTLDDMAEQVLEAAPQKAVWLGWSLGGLVVSQIALRHPERVQALITVASSPCFSAREAWPGIKPEVLAGFQVEVLNGGLEILKTADLREPLASLTVPHLRIYGYLDGLVPRKVVPLLDALWPESKSMVVAKAAHAPFISHPAEFCSALSGFISEASTTP